MGEHLERRPLVCHALGMPPIPKLGNCYTRDQISAMVGGSVQSPLPTRNGRVVCGCFKLDQNPDAPKEVLVGLGPQRENSAKTVVLQLEPIPVFVKREVGEWEYIGIYRATRYLHQDHKMLQDEERTKKPDVAGILYMEPVGV